MTNSLQNPPANSFRIPPRLRLSRGFTLIEMMLVLAMIAVLLSTAIYYMVGNLESARIQAARADIISITTQLKGYEMDNSFLPTNEQGLKALVEEPSTDPKPRHWHPWLQKMPEDPWHMPYVYRNPGTHNPGSFDLYSYGPDKKENPNVIGNWEDAPKQ